MMSKVIFNFFITISLLSKNLQAQYIHATPSLEILKELKRNETYTSYDTITKKSVDKMTITSVCITLSFLVILMATVFYKQWKKKQCGERTILFKKNQEVKMSSNLETVGALNQFRHQIDFPQISQNSSWNTCKIKYPSYGIVGPNDDFAEKYSIEKVQTNEKKTNYFEDSKKKMPNRSVANYKLENSEQNYNKNDNEIAEELTFTKNNTKLQHSLLFQDEENSEGEFTVYECSGFASMTNEPLEIKNPFFQGSRGSVDTYTSSNSDITTPTTPTNKISFDSVSCDKLFDYNSQLSRNVCYK